MTFGITAAHLHDEVFDKMVPALITMAHVPILAISTPDNENNYYSKLPEQLHPDTGEPLFCAIRIGLACQACIDRRISCVHMKHHIPPWKTGERQRIASALASSEVTRKNEMFGIIAGSDTYCFTKVWIDTLVSRDQFVFHHPVKVLHTGIDVGGGGESSDSAILTLAHEEALTIVRTRSQRHKELAHVHHEQRHAAVVSRVSRELHFGVQPVRVGFHAVEERGELGVELECERGADTRVGNALLELRRDHGVEQRDDEYRVEFVIDLGVLACQAHECENRVEHRRLRRPQNVAENHVEHVVQPRGFGLEKRQLEESRRDDDGRGAHCALSVCV